MKEKKNKVVKKRPAPFSAPARPTPDRLASRPTPDRPAAHLMPDRPAPRPTPDRPEPRRTPDRPEPRPTPDRSEPRPTHELTPCMSKCESDAMFGLKLEERPISTVPCTKSTEAGSMAVFHPTGSDEIPLYPGWRENIEVYD